MTAPSRRYLQGKGSPATVAVCKGRKYFQEPKVQPETVAHRKSSPHQDWNNTSSQKGRKVQSPINEQLQQEIM